MYKLVEGANSKPKLKDKRILMKNVNPEMRYAIVTTDMIEEIYRSMDKGRILHITYAHMF